MTNRNKNKNNHKRIFLSITTTILILSTTPQSTNATTTPTPTTFIRPNPSNNTTSPTPTPPTPTHTLPPELNLTIHENLLTPHECTTLTTLALRHLRPSRVGRPPLLQPTLRTALSTKLPRLPFPTLWSIEHKLARAAGVPVERGEDLQVGGYPVGNYYGMHCDERRGGRANGGGRLATALAYLNSLDGGLVGGGYTVFSGRKMHLPGGVDFPRSDVRVRELERLSCEGEGGGHVAAGEATRVAPREGRVITFRNLAECPLGGGDAAGGRYRFIEGSTHGASRVFSKVDPPPGPGTPGTVKYVVQQWFGLENEVNVSRHPGLISHLGLGVADSYRADGVEPMMDLASEDGSPRGFFVDGGGAGGGSMESVNSLMPNIRATRIRGPNASIESPGLPIPTHVDVSSGPVAAGVWFLLGNNHNQNECPKRIFRVGPHELSVSNRGQIVWSIIHGKGKSSWQTRSEPGKIVPGRWYHLALAVDPPSSSGSGGKLGTTTVMMTGEVTISVPGQAPSPPLAMEVRIDGDIDAENLVCPKWVEGISLGGRPEGLGHGDGEGNAGEVDLTLTDFYAVREDMKGKGTMFAFAIVYYDPMQGI